MGTIFVDNLEPQSGTTLTLGASGDTITVPSGVTASGFGGITEADQWRLTANKTSTGDITANLERVDTAGFGYLGTGMTESSGIFTFPSTGIYKITINMDGAYDRVIIKTTTDNSTYINASHVAQYYGSAEFIFDVTNTSTHKVKFNYDTYSTGLVGDTDVNRTHFTFIRLGDT